MNRHASGAILSKDRTELDQRRALKMALKRITLLEKRVNFLMKGTTITHD